jgi:hypothetical protein
MMLKLEMLERKSEALGAYGFAFRTCFLMPCVPRFSSLAGPLERGPTSTISERSEGRLSAFAWGHIVDGSNDGVSIQGFYYLYRWG